VILVSLDIGSFCDLQVTVSRDFSSPVFSLSIKQLLLVSTDTFKDNFEFSNVRGVIRIRN
jgi:hypothetical protein